MAAQAPHFAPLRSVSLGGVLCLELFRLECAPSQPSWRYVLRLLVGHVLFASSPFQSSNAKPAAIDTGSVLIGPWEAEEETTAAVPAVTPPRCDRRDARRSCGKSPTQCRFPDTCPWGADARRCRRFARGEQDQCQSRCRRRRKPKFSPFRSADTSTARRLVSVILDGVANQILEQLDKLRAVTQNNRQILTCDLRPDLTIDDCRLARARFTASLQLHRFQQV